MNLWLRLLKVLISALLRPRLGLLDESRLSFRVWPVDLDLNIHMNNARYLAHMDLGRVDIILRTGLGKIAMRHKLQPVIGSVMVRFRKSLQPFERFTLRSRVLGWNAKWFFFEHRIERQGELVCLAIAKGLFLNKSGQMPSAQLVGDLGHEGQSPILPQWIADWEAAESAQNAQVQA